jgi:hypothetical protein
MLVRFVVLPFLFWSSMAMATGLDFELKNATGYDIEAVYVDPSDSDEWSGDILEEDTELADGASASVTFQGDPEGCKWDLKVDWVGDYEPTVWKSLNLCKISKITLKYDRKTDETTAVLDE